eukprot:jgi/Mesvir1/19585/Mv09887-RA.1
MTTLMKKQQPQIPPSAEDMGALSLADKGDESSSGDSLTPELLRKIPEYINKVVTLMQNAKKAFPKGFFHQKGCTMVSSRVQMIQSLLFELSELAASKSMPPLHEPLRELQRSLKDAVRVVRMCVSPGSVRMFLYCDKVAAILQDVMKHIGDALEKFLEPKYCLSDDAKDQVTLMVQQVRGFDYAISDDDQQLFAAMHKRIGRRREGSGTGRALWGMDTTSLGLVEALQKRLGLTRDDMPAQMQDLMAEAARLRKSAGGDDHSAIYMERIAQFLQAALDATTATNDSMARGGSSPRADARPGSPMLRDLDSGRSSRMPVGTTPQGNSTPPKLGSPSLGDACRGGSSPATERDVNIDDSWVIDVDNDVEKQGLLGKGRSGSVYRAVWKSGRIPVAIKELVLPTKSPPAEVLAEFAREVSSHMRLHHPNVVRLYGAAVAPPRLCMIMEVAELGSLHDVLKSPLPWKVRLHFARDMAVGLKFLHDRKMLHRDIKSLNMLVFQVGGSAGGGSGLLVKLSDFGLSVTKAEAAMGTLQDFGDTKGTPNWTAPEVWEGKAYTRRSEVYAYGVILYELATGRFPYHGKPVAEIIGLALRGVPPADIPPDCPPEFRQLMQQCISRQPDDRPELTYILTKMDELINSHVER